MNALPEIVIGQHGIENWDEVFRWAVDNDPLWRRCREVYGHLSKERFLETLTAHQLQANMEITKNAIEIAKQRLPLPNCWRFDWSADQ